MFSVDYGKNYNSNEHKIEKFGTSDLENKPYKTYFFYKM